MQQEDPLEALEHRNAGSDEIGEVLAALRVLLARADSPIVRACLEEAHDDIAHLTGRDNGLEDEGVEVA
jgi:hypothetical protein